MKKFNEVVKGRRPNEINNTTILDGWKLIENSYIVISSDMLTFLRNWYGLDLKIEVLSILKKQEILRMLNQAFKLGNGSERTVFNTKDWGPGDDGGGFEPESIPTPQMNSKVLS